MGEQENTRELRGKLIRAKDIEEVRAILGPETAEEEIDQVWQEIEAHRPAEGLEEVDDDELEAVSGGADRDWEKEGCSASAEYGSRCWSDDYCTQIEVTYSNFDPCPEGGRHDWDIHEWGEKTYDWIVYKTSCRYRVFQCTKCDKKRTEYLD